MRRIVPFSPITVPVLPSKKITLVSVLLVPLDWAIQVAPPSMVRRIVPFSPTAVPVLASVKDAHNRRPFSGATGFFKTYCAVPEPGVVEPRLTTGNFTIWADAFESALPKLASVRKTLPKMRIGQIRKHRWNRTVNFLFNLAEFKIAFNTLAEARQLSRSLVWLLEPLKLQRERAQGVGYGSLRTSMSSCRCKCCTFDSTR